MLALVLTLPGVPAHSQTLSSTEMSAGAAAVVVLAQKCLPSEAHRYRQAAWTRLQQLSNTLSNPGERQFALDSFDTKIKAMTLSSQREGCDQADKLRQFIRNWGFAHFLE